MRCALYARCSTDTQTLDPQTGPLREYARARGWEAREFLDPAVSGRKARRPGLDAMLAAARRREVDAVVVVKLDRLARSTRDLLNTAQELKDLGVALVVIEQQIDTTTSAGELLFTMLAAIAQFEAALTRERVMAGLAAARRRGQRLGRPSKLDTGALKRAKRLASSGQSIRAIAEQLGCSPVTALRAVRGRR